LRWRSCYKEQETQARTGARRAAIHFTLLALWTVP